MMKFLFVVIVIMALVPGCDDSQQGIQPEQLVYIHTRPAWSPNGQTIAFTLQSPGQFGIWLVDTNGTNFRQLHAGVAFGAAWSPDGNWVTFSEGNQIFARNIFTDSLRMLVQTLYSIQPAWSPGGNEILFLRTTNVQLVDLELFVKNLLDQTERSLLQGSLLQRDAGAAWMPSGTQAFFVREQYTGGPESYVYSLQTAAVDAPTLNTVTVINSAYPCFWFRYDSVNARVLYEYAPPNRHRDIRVLELQLGVTRTLVSNGGSDPALSPDGGMVAYTATASDEGGIWIVNIDGTGNRRITKP